MSSCVICGKAVYDKITNGLCWGCIDNWKQQVLNKEEI